MAFNFFTDFCNRGRFFSIVTFLRNKKQNYSNPIKYFDDNNNLQIIKIICTLFVLSLLLYLLNSIFFSYNKYRRLVFCGCRRKRKYKYGKVNHKAEIPSNMQMESPMNVLRVSTKNDSNTQNNKINIRKINDEFDN